MAKATRFLALMLAALTLLAALPALTSPAKADEALPYWIGVDVKNQRVTIYSTENNGVIHRWLCSTGLSGTPTPQGVYYLPGNRNSRKEWAKFGSVYVKYPVRIKGGYYFHSVLFSRRNDNSMQVSTLNKLGHAASHGCIRLEVAHAKWISDNVPSGTMVVIHSGVDDTRITSILGGNAGVETTPSLPAPPVVTGLALDQSGTVVLNKGQTLQLNCTIIPSNATTTLKWKSSKKKAVTVDGNGLVTAVGNGTATITVTAANGVKTTVKVQSVDTNAPARVVLSHTGIVTINVGDALQLGAALEPATAQSALTWKSSRARYATVDESGLVTGLAKGTTKITVQTYNKKRATVTIRVIDPYAPQAVRIAEGGPITLHVGEALPLHAVLTPDTAKTTYTWSSGRRRVAVVDADGVVTALAKGTAKITVKTANKKRATVLVKVVE